MWVLFAIAIIELIAVHLLVALKWPLIGWPLSILSALGAVWILVWIRSFRTHPHVLDAEVLTLSLGRFKTVRLASSDIASVTASWEQGALQKSTALNLAGIAFPNRCIKLHQPTENGKAKVYIRLDEPDRFDRECFKLGIHVV